MNRIMDDVKFSYGDKLDYVSKTRIKIEKKDNSKDYTEKLEAIENVETVLFDGVSYYVILKEVSM